MAVPTVETFLQRFPRFDGQDDLIAQLINEASRAVDADMWLAADYTTAIMYLVAHYMLTEEAAEEGEISSMSIPGAYSVTFRQRTSDDQLETTEYGRRYCTLRSNNFPGILAV